ncbi:MAG TPA: hypothetical protein VH087_20730, partial [Thermoanaerobaculia bacterium]|nr:hypothetical protein [Thermoanaerobaculia bacterium]
VSERRRYVLREIAARRPAVTLVEVDSDLRSSWLNGFPPTVGYQVSVNELTDTFLYLAALIAAAWTRGATHLFLASEAEVQESAELEGNIVQHPHAMYSVVTQSAVSSLLSRVGMSYGSLLSPLRSQQIQQLLWTRYPDLADLQYSCWRVAPDEATCSRCSQCLRVAFAALSIGESPARMGINLVNLMHALHGWEPRRMAGPLVLPGDRVTADLHAQTVRTIVMTPLLRFAKALGRRRYTPRGLLAIDRFRRLRRRLGRQTVAAARGYRPAYLACVDPLVREPIAGIYAAAFSPDDAAEQETNRRRGERLIRHITEPLSVASINEGDV